MRVLLVSKTYPLQAACDGTGAMANVIAEGLVERGHEVLVLSSNWVTDAQRNGVAVRARLVMDQPEPYKPPTEWTLGDKLLWIKKGRHNYAAVRKQMREFGPDLVYLNDLELLTPSVFAACADAGVKCVWHVHDHILHDAVMGNSNAAPPTVRQRLIQRFVHNPRLEHYLATPVIAVSQFLAEKYCALGWPPEMVTVVPNGLPDCFFSAGPRTAPEAEAWHMLFVGRCVEDKGMSMLPEVLGSLQRRGITVRLVVVGSFQDEASRRAFMAEAELAGVQDRIDCRGALPRQQLPAAYRQAACLLAPSRCAEAFGLMSAEAQACGTPVIASRIGGLPETLRDGSTGWLCEPGNAEAMADRVAQLYLDPVLWAEMSRAARDFAAGAFRLHDKLDCLEQTIARVAAG